MSNLPLVFNDKENSPDLEAFFQQFGIEKFISAPEFNRMRDAINELYFAGGSIGGDKLLIVGNNGVFEKDGQNIIVPEGTSWILDSQTYTLNEDYPVFIPLESEGMNRFDRIVGNNQGECERVPGTPHENTPFIPGVPVGKIPITIVPILGNTIGEPEPPIIGSEFVKKMGYRNVYLTAIGGTAALVLSEDKRNTVIQSYTGSMVIDGFKDGMPGQPSTLYQGMNVTIDNQTSEEVPINDMTNSTNPNSDIKMDFRSGISQYVMKPGELLTFKLRGSVLVFVSTNKAETDIEVPTKTSDLINDGADNTSTYIEFSDVGVPNGVAPTGSDNKIPLSFFSDAILGQVVFGGTVVPATGVATLSTNAKTKLGTTDATITLTNDTTPITGYEANEGIYYIAFDDGTFGGITLTVGDWLISTGSGWSKIDNTDAVTMVNGKTGAVTLISEDIGYNNATSGLDAENEQEAIDELSAKKEDRVSVIPISANTTISSLHHGKILLITADVTITFPTGLGAGFTGCAFRITTGGKMTPAFASGVTGGSFFADYNPGESLYVFKESDSTNVFYAV